MATKKEEKGLQVASFTGIYRCTGMGMTDYVTAGQTLPRCNCRRIDPEKFDRDCEWEFHKADNCYPDNSTFIFVGQGILHTFETDELPEEGTVLNLRSGWKNSKLNGSYRVTALDTLMWKNEEYFYIHVERIGDIDPNMPINSANPMNC